MNNWTAARVSIVFAARPAFAALYKPCSVDVVCASMPLSCFGLFYCQTLDRKSSIKYSIPVSVNLTTAIALLR